MSDLAPLDHWDGCSYCSACNLYVGNGERRNPCRCQSSQPSDLEKLLSASLEMEMLRKENAALKKERDELAQDLSVTNRELAFTRRKNRQLQAEIELLDEQQRAS